MEQKNFNLHSFYSGYSFDAYEYFGAHPDENGCQFRVFAPAAKAVALICCINDWQPLPMHLSGGVWSLYLKGVKPGMIYKYKIVRADDEVIDHCDPYGFGMELRPNSASVVRELNQDIFTDAAWMKKQHRGHNSPINIYEIHAGCFKHKQNTGNFPDDWYNYEELAEVLIPYLKENGYTHVELMPLSEHPVDMSWGYQNTGFFAPTSRYGTALQLQKFVNAFHLAQIGVILDFVPVHFATDDYGLSYFDGSFLYEYSSDDTGYSEWGTKNFNVTRGEVQSFLKSCANYWLTEYHIDGLRMDAISRAIYWQGQEERGINERAIEFLASMNNGLHYRHPGVMLIAEDSTNFNKVTAPAIYQGLDFDYKWDMGWMNDTLDFLATPAFERKWHYHKLTFSMMYFHRETYMLPLSHDENVHSKKTILDKIYGSYEQKFAQGRALYLYMYTHPGKKMDFMGDEFGMLREFDETRELDWGILSYPMHDSFLHFRRTLHRLYLNLPALSQNDYHPEYFKWLVVNDEDHVVYAYQRGKGVGAVVVVLNFCDCDWNDYTLHFEHEVVLSEALNTDNCIYSGNTIVDEHTKYQTQLMPDGTHQLKLDLKAFSGRMFVITECPTPHRLSAIPNTSQKPAEYRGGNVCQSKI